MTTLSEPTVPQLKKDPQNPGRRALTIFLITVALFVVYAFTVQTLEINLEKPLNPERQEAFLRVMRLLADPDIIRVDEVSGSWALSETVYITLERIVETLFMALIATTIGTIFAVPVSFLAARNLMRPVNAPLAAIMAALVALPIGGGLGLMAARLTGLMAAVGTQRPLLGLLGFLIAAALAYAVLALGPPLLDEGKRTRSQWLVTIGRLLLGVMLALLALSFVANLGLTFGKWLEDMLGPLGFIGNFIFVLSDFLHLGLPAFMTLLGAFLGATYGSRYGQEAVLSLGVMPARILTAVLTFLGTAVFIYGVGSALNWLYLFDNPAAWTTIPALIGGAVAALIALFLAPKRPFSIGFAIYTVSRAILNILRSIEPLIMAIVFVVWVSLGPFAGIMALTLHTIAALGKLFSEQIEGIDEGPIEAINATGANRLQMIVFAVIPQIVPPYIAFTLYRWDINVRLSTIIGFVGGGGIGFVLSQNIQQLRYRQASVMMLAIAIVVSLLDYLSSRVRSRII